MTSGAISSTEECIAWGLAERDRKLNELAIFAFAKVLDERGGIMPGDPSFMRDWTDEEVSTFLAKTIEMIEMTLADGEELQALIDEHRYDYLDLGKTGSLEDIENMIRFGCKNFAEWHVKDCATE